MTSAGRVALSVRLSPQSFFAPTPMGLGAGRPGTGTALGSSFPEGRMWDLRSAYTGYFVQCVLRLALSLARSAPTPGAALLSEKHQPSSPFFPPN